MPHVIWSQPALSDVVRLHAFLASHNRETAQRAIRTIRAHLRRLARHPEIGRHVPEMLPEFREWIIPFGQSAYLALYHVTGEQIVILAVRHGREAGY